MLAPHAAPFLWFSVVKGLVRTLRPHQWVKNVFVLAPIVFHKDLFVETGLRLNLHVVGPSLLGCALFCLLSGAVYTWNDLMDVEADKLHPIKCTRPIASGQVPPSVAYGMVFVLVLGSLGGAYLLAPRFSLFAVAYLLQNLLYTGVLKHVVFVDVVILACGFVLRLLAGGAVAHVSVSAYMLACTAWLSLFLGFGKRRHELLVSQTGKTRKVLRSYPPGFLQTALVVTGGATLYTYIAYTLDPATCRWFHSDRLWWTTPCTVFGLCRFLLLVSGKAGRGVHSESPTQEMLRDPWFVINLGVWLFVMLRIVYPMSGVR